MKKSIRKKEERQVEEILRGVFGHAFKRADFCYWKGSKGFIVTYEDFKPEFEMLPVVCRAVGDGWKAVLKREYSERNVMETMLGVYRSGSVSVCYTQDGNIVMEDVRTYVNRLMAVK